MSNRHVIQDLIYNIVDMVTAERDTLQRIRLANEAQQSINSLLEIILETSTYTARKTHHAEAISIETGLERERMTALVRAYRAKNPEAPEPKPHRKDPEVGIDLGRSSSQPTS